MSVARSVPHSQRQRALRGTEPWMSGSITVQRPRICPADRLRDLPAQPAHDLALPALSTDSRTVRLLPQLYAHLNPMPFEAAVQMEMDLAADLRVAGYTVTGGK